MKFEVIKANIVDVNVDAIVLPANTKLKEGSGTSRAIFSKAGRKELSNACKRIGQCQVGDAVPTLGYALNSKYIIHAVVPKWVDGNHQEYELLSSAYLAALNVGDVMECESIAFPLLASGNNGFDKRLAIQIADESIGRFESKNLKKVYLVVYGTAVEFLARELGYDVSIIPEKEQKGKVEKIIKEGTGVAQKFLEDQINKAMVWLDEPENREKVIQYGMQIAMFVLNKKKKKGSIPQNL